MSLSSRESDRVAVWALNRKALQTEINAHQRANEESITRVDRLRLGKTFMLISSNPPLKRLLCFFQLFSSGFFLCVSSVGTVGVRAFWEMY